MRVRLTEKPLMWKFATAAALVIALVAAGGCYRRVVGVKGPGASAYDVYEPNLKTREDTQKKNNVYTVPTKNVPTQVAPDR